MSVRKTVKNPQISAQESGDPIAVNVEFHDAFMYVYLQDGRYISVPVTTYRRLREATPEQREQVEISPRGISLHWDEIDEDLSVSGLARDFGAKEVEAKGA
ncbi:MAG TPA: DUF2442 domain-containing protein [Chloroflexia bacterium]|jgi:hypothetical protein